MIYQPLPVLDLRVLIGLGIVDAVIAAIDDFVAQANKPWTYYLGVGIGGMIGATGLPDAVATAYVVCNSLDVYLFHSPQGGLVKFYVDGLLQATIDAYAGTAGEVLHSITLANDILHRIDIVNGPPGPSNSSGFSWLGIGQLTANNGYIAERGTLMTTDILSYGIVDGDGDHKSVPIYIPHGLTLAQMQTFATAQAALLNAVIDGMIDSITATFTLTIPGGLNGTPANGVEAQKGALLDFVASGTPYKFGLYVPTWKPSLFTGDNANLNDSGPVDAFVGSMVAGATPAFPSDKYGNDLTGIVRAVKRFRK